MPNKLPEETERIVPCRCHEDYTSRKRHEPRWPGGNCDDVRDVVERGYRAGYKAALMEAARIVLEHETEHYKGIRPRDKYMAGEHLESIGARLRALAEGEK